MQNLNQREVLNNSCMMQFNRMSDQVTFPEFIGYWRELNQNDLPNASGVYCVYECFYDPFKQKVFLNELIYVGESDDVNKDVNHQKQNLRLPEHIRPGHELCYSFGSLEPENRKRIQYALIRRFKPPANIEYERSIAFKRVFSEQLTLLLT